MPVSIVYWGPLNIAFQLHLYTCHTIVVDNCSENSSSLDRITELSGHCKYLKLFIYISPKTSCYFSKHCIQLLQLGDYPYNANFINARK